MGVARKWHFSTSKIATNLGGDSRDLNEHRGSGITFLGISSLNRHFLVLFPGPNVEPARFARQNLSVEIPFLILFSFELIINFANFHQLRNDQFRRRNS